MKRSTVAAYVGASAFQMDKALTAAAQCETVTDAELANIVKALRLLRALHGSFKRGKK